MKKFAGAVVMLLILALFINGISDALFEKATDAFAKSNGTTQTTQTNTPAATEPTVVEDTMTGFTYFYTEMGPEEMTEERAAFRIACDSTRYMESVLANDGWYRDELNEWIREGDTWDYAVFEGTVDYIEYQDGYTLTILKLPYIDRRVIASFHGKIIFNIGDPVTTYGIIAPATYYESVDNEMYCFAMEVLDYVSGSTHTAMSVHAPWYTHEYEIAEAANAGPFDWSQVPQACYDAWVGTDVCFGSGDGIWYRVTPDKAAGCPYTVRYWLYDPIYNQLSLAVSFDWAGDGTYNGQEAGFTWLMFCDAHLVVGSPADLNLNELTSNYEYTDTEYFMLREAANRFYGTVMYWPEGEG